MLVPAAAPPAITPPPNLARAVHGGLLAPRQLNGAGGNAFGNNNDCYYGAGVDINGMQECNNALSCDYNRYTDASYIKECYCNYGMSYLDCYWDKLGTCVTQLFGTTNWRDFQTSYFIDYCGSIPPSAFAQIQPPSEVPLSFTQAKVVTTPGRIAVPTNVAPKYQGTGQLLAGACSASTDYTLVNAGATVYAAGVVGCNGNRPECCPWKVGEMGSANGATAAGGSSNDQSKNRVGVDFPLPAENAQAVLTGCAQDYYSVSGGCCPVGYWPFTAAVGGQTPCYSSVNRMTVGTVTVGADDEKEKDTSKPTSAVVNIVWSMHYQVEAAPAGLSTGAKAGIGAGIGIVLIALVGFGAWFFLRRRRNKKLAGEKAGQPPVAAAVAAVPGQADSLPPKQPEQFFQQPQQPGLPPMGQFPPGQFPPGQYPPGTVFMPAPGAPPPSDQMNYTTPTNMSVSSPSPLYPQHTGASFGAVSEVSSSGGQPAGYLNGQGYPAPIAEGNEPPVGQPQPQQQQYYAYAAFQQQEQQRVGSPLPQIQPVPGTVPSPPPQAQKQQQFVPPQTGPISPQELQGNQQQLPPQTGPIFPQELQGNQQQLPPQMVWDQNAGGYVLPQQQAQQFYQPQPQQPTQQPPQ